MNKTQPAQIKYFTAFKGGRIKAFKGTAKYFLPKKCQYGLKATKGARVSALQLKAAFEKARLYSRKFTNSERIIMSVFPSHAFAKKAVGQRMGSGKGPTGYYGFNCRSGQVIMEMDGEKNLVLGALRKAKSCFPMTTEIVDYKGRKL